MITPRVFFAAEIQAFKPGSVTITYDQGHGVHPHGTLAQFADQVQSTATITASDMGYRTAPSDPQGVVSYPPLIDSAFQIDRKLNLDPTQSAVGAAWGSISLNNADGRFDILAGTWNSDNRPVTILYGLKTSEDFPGYATIRSSVANYFDTNATMQQAAANAVRYDFSSSPSIVQFIPRSNDFTVSWSFTNVSQTSDGTLAPDGSTAALVIDNATNGPHFANIQAPQMFSPANRLVTFSIYVMPQVSGTQFITLSLFDQVTTTNNTRCGYDLLGGVRGTIVNGGTAASTNATITNLGTGWYLVTLSVLCTPGSTASMIARFGMGTTLNGGLVSYVGTGVGFYAWGAQINLGGVAQTLLPTLTAPAMDFLGPPVALNEPAATNLGRNPRQAGAITGTPGTLPTNAGQSQNTGLNLNVLAIGTELGLPYVDYQLTGTTASGTNNNLFFEASNFMPATVGQTVTYSHFLRIANGTMTNIAGGIRMILGEYDSSGTSLGLNTTTTMFVHGGPLPSQRYSVTRTMTSASCAFCRMQIQIVPNAAPVAVGLTLRCGPWQVEAGAVATSQILPPVGAPAATTRAADNLVTARQIMLDPAYATLLPAFAGVATPWDLTDTDLVVPLRDNTYFIEEPLQTNIYGGTGTYDGTAVLTGKPKPKARGGTSSFPIPNVSPILLDPAKLIYQYTDGPGTVVAAYEGAAVVWTYSGDVADLYVGSAAAGTYRTNNARGLFQLGSQPQRTVTIDCTGAFPSAGAISNCSQLARYILTEDLVVPTAAVNIASFTVAPGTDPANAIGGVWWGSDSNVDGPTALNQIVESFGGVIMPSRAGLLTLFLLRSLPGTAVAVAAFDMSNCVSLLPQPLPASVQPPTWRVRVAYDANYTVMSSGVSPSATVARQQFVAGVGPSAAVVQSTIQATWLRPNDLGPLPSILQQQSDALAVAGIISAIWGQRRRLYALAVPTVTALARDIGDVVQLTWPMDDLRGGRLGQIVGEQWNSSDPTITLMVLV
jgi:hypothetical protein